MNSYDRENKFEKKYQEFLKKETSNCEFSKWKIESYSLRKVTS
ncbi:6203_t:CDS:2 [Funneliformis mosseae]|uniref:6203_t:CDS:1 n=1 Tax=Funneliformis mosseae TaxID=27381 RepID=A0A9N9GZZ4_FUNMO|nr:6203_t:CDS:2 [Funneliformis mosseae]